MSKFKRAKKKLTGISSAVLGPCPLYGRHLHMQVENCTCSKRPTEGKHSPLPWIASCDMIRHTSDDMWEVLSKIRCDKCRDSVEKPK